MCRAPVRLPGRDGRLVHKIVEISAAFGFGLCHRPVPSVPRGFVAHSRQLRCSRLLLGPGGIQFEKGTRLGSKTLLRRFCKLLRTGIPESEKGRRGVWADERSLV